ncbi:MAG: Asp-tRNA(Asn)/Glu-tRNA(Gln) amidotransferase subunit GatB [Chloroflexi bacterium]|nr:Asp-tRNA(Asn)/Glu-tRNA(Gln) amidotransferase subunit GatB [Chloroflexota bacterium]
MTTASALEFETVIGMEVHAHLLTRSKMFCPCPLPSLDSPPNTDVCPICLGMPGVLPVINKRAVELTIMTGLALDCQIAEHARFDRKNYHYPDLMKGYQISEYDEPLCRNGRLEVEVDGGKRGIGVTRVHLEEDVAKLYHVTNPAGESYSLVDVNRSGVPLMEIVSEPDIRTPEEARAYLVELRRILRYIGASRANMEEGNMRCEPNVSVRPRGSSELGTKVELKNINSFRHVYDAIKFEVERQVGVLRSGGRIVQETRGWRPGTGEAVPQRSKEYANDYRYFPEPDLPPLAISRDWVEEIRSRMPELPAAKRERFQARYGLSPYDVNLLTESRARADFFEAAVALVAEERQRAKAVANWVNGDFAALLNAQNVEIEDAKVTPQHLSELIDLIEAGTITGAAAKAVFLETFAGGRAPREVVEERGLAQIIAGDEIASAVDRVVAANPKAVEDYRGGKQEAIKFLVGQVMRETRGRSDPNTARELLERKLGGAAS